VIAAIAAALGPHAPAGLPGERLERLRGDRRSLPFGRARGTIWIVVFAVGLLLADSLTGLPWTVLGTAIVVAAFGLFASNSKQASR
jgi:hypothetical protein